MAQVESYPVYKEAMRLLVFMYRQSIRIDRAYRYTLVEELKRAMQRVLEEIYIAALAESLPDRLLHIEEALHSLQRFQILFRVLRELNQLSNKEMAQYIPRIDAVSKQLTNWMRYVKAQVSGKPIKSSKSSQRTGSMVSSAQSGATPQRGTSPAPSMPQTASSSRPPLGEKKNYRGAHAEPLICPPVGPPPPRADTT